MLRFIWVACLMAFIGFGCGGDDATDGGGTPTVRLVKDTSDSDHLHTSGSYHLQWDEPLLADRIVLVHVIYNPIKYTNRKITFLFGESHQSEKFTLPNYHRELTARLRGELTARLKWILKGSQKDGFYFERTGLGQEEMWVDFRFPYLGERVIEDYLYICRTGNIQSEQIQVSQFSPSVLIKLPPADDRFNNLELPKSAYNANGEGDEKILVEYPFQPYKVGDPSELTFEWRKEGS